MRLASFVLLVAVVAAACYAGDGGTPAGRLTDESMDLVRGLIPPTQRVQGDPCSFQSLEGDEVTEADCVNPNLPSNNGSFCVECKKVDVAQQSSGGPGIQFVA